MRTVKDYLQETKEELNRRIARDELDTAITDIEEWLDFDTCVNKFELINNIAEWYIDLYNEELTDFFLKNKYMNYNIMIYFNEYYKESYDYHHDFYKILRGAMKITIEDFLEQNWGLIKTFLILSNLKFNKPISKETIKLIEETDDSDFSTMQEFINYFKDKKNSDGDL